jgi:hypothetical protein
MNFHSILSKIVFLSLLIFFVSRVYISLKKLNEKKIGTIQRHETIKTVLYPTVTICPEDYHYVLDQGKNDTISDPAELSDLLNMVMYSYLEDNRYVMHSLVTPT